MPPRSMMSEKQNRNDVLARKRISTTGTMSCRLATSCCGTMSGRSRRNDVLAVLS